MPTCSPVLSGMCNGAAHCRRERLKHMLNVDRRVLVQISMAAVKLKFLRSPTPGPERGGKRKRGGRRAPPSDAERSDAEHRKAASPAYCMVLVGRSPGVTVEPL